MLRLFVRPITAILGKVPMVRAGNSGTVLLPQCCACTDISKRFIQEENAIRQPIGVQFRETAACCGTSTLWQEMVAEGMKMGSQSCVEFVSANYLLLQTFSCNNRIKHNYTFLHAIT
jgi:hypothetical protein